MPPRGYADEMKPILIQPHQPKAWANELRCLRMDLLAQSRHYRDIRPPVAILAGQNDPFDRLEFQSGRVSQEVKRVRLTVLPATGNAVHHAHPQAVTSALRAVHRDSMVRVT
jgi:pimeloyl-ACP methyl ester carboxylesterase